MEKNPTLLEKAALLRDKANRAFRLAAGLAAADHARLRQFGEALRQEAQELERQAAAQGQPRPPQPSRDTTRDERKADTRRSGSSEPEPHT